VIQKPLLIFVRLDAQVGAFGIERAVKSLSLVGNILALSSIYKKQLNPDVIDFNAELIFVIKLETSFSYLQILDELKKIHGIPVEVLAFAQEIRMIPGQNLPHTLLHSDEVVLRCASEAWGSYEHPVLGQTLNELVRSSRQLMNVDFFAQGTKFLPVVNGAEDKV